MPRPLTATLVVLALLAGPRTLIAQAAGAGPVASALARRDAGDLAGAADLLRSHLARVPSDTEARRHLAQLTYWLGDVRAARAAYVALLRDAPQDTTAALDYGQLLVEQLDHRSATDVLLPLSREGRGAPRAAALLAQLALWRGDQGQARTLADRALAADPAQPLARMLRDSLTRLMAPTISATTSGRWDDQPLRLLQTVVTADLAVTPDWRLGVEAGLSGAERETPDGRATLQDGALRLSGATARGALRLDARLGTHRRSYGRPSDLVGHLRGELRVAGPWSLRATVDRSPYLQTASALGTAVLPDAVELGVALRTRGGVLAEAATQSLRFADENRIGTRYAWVLLPVPAARRLGLQLGYAWVMQDSDDIRFAPLPQGVIPSRPPGPGLQAGWFDPYFTPVALRGHSALLSAVLPLHPRVRLAVDGRVGLVSDREPYLVAAGAAPPTLGTFARRYTPIELRSEGRLALSARDALRVGAAYRRTIFFSRRELSVGWTHRLGR